MMSIPRRQQGVRPAISAAFLLLGAAFLLAGCGDDSSTPTPVVPPPTTTPPTQPPAEPDPEPAAPETRTYDLEYTAYISSNETLQVLQGAAPFPDGVGAAPPLAMIAHPVDTVLWEEGGIASDGLKVLAEMGDSSGFIAEAEEMGFAVLMSTSEELSALLLTPEITLGSDMPCVTFAQMIAPSPDWFFGFSAVCAADDEGNWLEEVQLASVAYDAGTAEGVTFAFKAEGGDTDPREPIAQLDMPPFSPPGTPLSEIVATLRPE